MRISREIRRRLDAVCAKRPKTVIRHLLAHGSITTFDLSHLYGYDHPPRAIRDVRELGIPIERFNVKDKDGKIVTAYRFGDLKAWKNVPRKVTGRTQLAKALKNALVEKFGSQCAIYLETMDASLLQIDHRVPYEVGGEGDATNLDEFMLLCPSANRAKSWSCEHCENWQRKNVSFCLRCFWAHPENYDHVAGKTMRQISLMFIGDEIEDYRKLVKISGKETAQETIKRILHAHLDAMKEV